MSFTGFTQHDFDTFAIEGLDGRWLPFASAFNLNLKR